jgi:outer membrane receptor protein involved in Fe transport
MTQNAGNAQIVGAELELAWLFGRHLSFNGEAGYMDARYLKVNPFASQTTGPYLPKTPRLKLSLSPDVPTRLWNGATVRRVSLSVAATSPTGATSLRVSRISHAVSSMEETTARRASGTRAFR